jgi:hypothetical protein
MINPEDMLSQLQPQYFWDVDFSSLDLQKNKRLIIERVFTMGKLQEIHAVMGYYGSSVVIEVLTSLNYIDPKTLNFISKYYKIPKKKFKCYSRKRLKHPHWNS